MDNIKILSSIRRDMECYGRRAISLISEINRQYGDDLPEKAQKEISELTILASDLKKANVWGV